MFTNYTPIAFNLAALPGVKPITNRVAVWIGYYWLLLDIIRYFPYNFKIHELPGDKNAWK